MSHKIYPSSFVEPTGATTAAKFATGCPRYEAFKGHITIPREDIHAVYKMIGTLTEEYIKQLLPEDEQAEMQCEVPISRDLGDGVIVKGRADIVIGTRYIYEIKGTISKSKRTQIINKGLVDVSHLGQLITYMSELRITRGSIMAVYWHFNRDKTALVPELREFKIELDQNLIKVNGQIYKKSATALMSFYKIIKEAHVSKELPPCTSITWGCQYCPFNKICAKDPKDREEFIRYIEHNLDESKLKSELEPTIASHDARK